MSESSEPHSIDNEKNLKSRHQYTRDRLFNRISEDLTNRRTGIVEIVYQKCLQRPPLPDRTQETIALNTKYPLHQSDGLSFYSATLSHPVRHFRRTCELTLPHTQYFRDAQWRWWFIAKTYGNDESDLELEQRKDRKDRILSCE